jgi:hypothetical protein
MFQMKVQSESKDSEHNSVAWVRERTIPIERPPLVGEVSANFRGCHVVSVTDTYGRILDCFRPEMLIFFQLAP